MCGGLEGGQGINVGRYCQKSNTVCLFVCSCFLRVSLFDYQAMCKMNSHSVSSARPLLSVCTVKSLPIQIYSQNQFSVK